MTNAKHDCTGCPVSAGTHKPADAVHTEIAEPGANDLYEAILRLPCRKPTLMAERSPENAYAMGHRDARHAAADLVAATHEVELAALRARCAAQQAELVKEAARTAEQKLRADQMSAQHETQAALNREARAKLAAGVPAAAPDARDVPAQAVLDGRWKRRMLDGRTLVRDTMGFGDHPEMPVLDEGMKPREFFAALGIELTHTMAEDDLELEEHEAMNDAGNWSAWTPRPPKGEGWLLVAIFDTEDGQAAWWMRDADAIAAQAGKGVQ